MMEVQHTDPETNERMRKLFLIGGRDDAEVVKNLRDAYNEAMDGIPNVVKLTQERIGRNDPCPCGSGKKLKKCCLWKLYAKPMVPITSAESHA